VSKVNSSATVSCSRRTSVLHEACWFSIVFVTRFMNKPIYTGSFFLKAEVSAAHGCCPVFVVVRSTECSSALTWDLVVHHRCLCGSAAVGGLVDFISRYRVQLYTFLSRVGFNLWPSEAVCLLRFMYDL